MAEEKGRLVDEIVSLTEAVYEYFMMAHVDAWSKVDLTMLQFKVLTGVCIGKRVASPSLGKHLGVSPSSLTRVVDELVRRGLIQRQEDPRDRRIVRLQGTDAGRELIHTLTVETMPESMRAALATLSAEDLCVLRDGIGMLNKAVRNVRPADEG